MNPAELDEYRARAEDFLRRLERELYENGAGLKDSLETSRVYDAFSDLFEGARVRSILEAAGLAGRGAERAGAGLAQRDAPGGPEVEEDRRRLRHLSWFAADGLLSLATRDLTDAIVSGETQAEVEFEGRRLPFRSCQAALANEPNPRARAALSAAREAVTRRINAQREERMATLHSLARELGFADYASLCATLKGLDLPALSRSMQGFLDDTEGLYTRCIEKAARTVLDMRLSEVSRHDIDFLFRGVEFDDMFRAERLLPVLESTVAAMGLPRERYPNIVIDAEIRELKSPRAFCCALDVPHDVVLVVRPHGGHDDYHGILHEAGHAWHYGSVAPDLAFEHRWLGDNSVTESYAFLFQYLMTDENWLAQRVDEWRADEYRRFAVLRKLYMLRRYAAKLIYETELHASSGRLEGMAREYAAMLSGALKVRYSEADYLADVDDGLYVADYLRAWMFETQLRRFFVRRFGERWHAYPEAGEVLRELFAEGQRFRAEELAAKLGMPGLSCDALVEEFSDTLSR